MAFRVHWLGLSGARFRGAGAQGARTEGLGVKLVVLGLALVVTACASPRGPEIACYGGLPAGARTYAFASGGAELERAGIEAAVSRSLAADGFTRADQKPDYLVEVLFSARPAKVGAYEKLAGADAPEWKLAPVKTPWWKTRQPKLGDVTIRFIDARTGAEAYRATASGRSDMGKTATEAAARFDALAQAAAAPCLPVT